MKKYLICFLVLFFSVSTYAQQTPTLQQLHQKIVDCIDGSVGRTQAAQFFDQHTENGQNPMSDLISSFYLVDNVFINGIAKVLNEQMNDHWTVDNTEEYWLEFSQRLNYITGLLKSDGSTDSFNGQQINRVSNGLITFLYLYYRTQYPKFEKTYEYRFIDSVRKRMSIPSFDLARWTLVLNQGPTVASSKR